MAKTQIQITERYIVSMKGFTPAGVVVTLAGLKASIIRGAGQEAIGRMTLTPAAQCFWQWYSEGNDHVREVLMRNPSYFMTRYLTSVQNKFSH